MDRGPGLGDHRAFRVGHPHSRRRPRRASRPASRSWRDPQTRDQTWVLIGFTVASLAAAVTAIVLHRKRRWVLRENGQPTSSGNWRAAGTGRTSRPSLTQRADTSRASSRSPVLASSADPGMAAGSRRAALGRQSRRADPLVPGAAVRGRPERPTGSSCGPRGPSPSPSGCGHRGRSCPGARRMAAAKPRPGRRRTASSSAPSARTVSGPPARSRGPVAAGVHPPGVQVARAADGHAARWRPPPWRRAVASACCCSASASKVGTAAAADPDAAPIKRLHLELATSPA